MYAVNATTNAMIPGCLQYQKVSESDPWNAAHLGACGVAPTAAPNLPVAVCADTDTAGCVSPASLGLLRLTLNRPVACNGDSSRQLILQGSRCGPGLGFVQWSSVLMPDGAGCSYNRSPTDRKFNNDWLGTCGVTPRNMPLPGVVCTTMQAEAGVNEFQSGAFTQGPIPPPAVRLPPPPSPLSCLGTSHQVNDVSRCKQPAAHQLHNCGRGMGCGPVLLLLLLPLLHLAAV
jgi:hypothetical protein